MELPDAVSRWGRSRRGRAVVVTIGSLALTAAVAAAGLPVGRTPGTASKGGQRFSPATIDNSAHIDVNNIDMWVTNHGSFAWDIETGNAGLIYPKGTQNTAVFAAGLWLGAQVGGEKRVAVAEYSQEYAPGPMVGGTFVPDNPAFHVYKIVRGDTTSSDYVNWPVDQGAPLDSLGKPLLIGDMTLWSVYNDADLSRHSNDAGNSTPLGVEIQQTTFGFSRTGALGNAVFLVFKVSNKGSNTLDSMYISLWSDPDLGGAADDLVGCDTALSVGYIYNATNRDVQYGERVPSVGFDFLQGPIVAGDTLGMTSFNKYINGTDPMSRFESYSYMQGLDNEGNEIVDPTTSTVSRFVFTGDPVTGTGWLDTGPSDRRLMLSTGPITMAPGDSQVIVAAIVIGQAADRLKSIALMKCYDQEVQQAYDLDFNLPPTPPSPLVTARPLDRAVDLLWDTAATSYSSVNAQQNFVFEGFNVYQGASGSGPWTRIATYDLVDNIQTTYEEACDPDEGVKLVTTQLGTDAGLQYHLVVTDDALKGGRLINGSPYYFAVTAYGYDTESVEQVSGTNLPGQIVKTLESAIVPCDADTNRTLQPLPGSIETGCLRIVPGSSGATLLESAAHLAGVSQGTVDVEVVNQAAVTGHTYRVTFRDSSGVIVWDLLDVTSSTYLLVGVVDQSGSFTSPVVDGFMIRVTSPTAGILAIQEVATCGGEAVDPPDAVESPAAPGGSLNSTGDWYEWSAGNDFTRHNWRNPTTHDYEIRFLAGATENAWDYVNDCGAPLLPFLVPIEAWDITTNTRITFQVLDGDGNAAYNWDDGIYFHDIPYASVDWSNPAVNDTTYDPACTGLSYRRFFFENYTGAGAAAGDWPCAGTVVRVLTNKPNLPEDVFEFTVPVSGTAAGTVVGTDLSRIRAVPNPYFTRSRYELNQFERVIKFTNLPASRKVTIRLFNLAGDLVRTLVKDAGTASDPAVSSQAIMRWDLNTDRSLPVASGVYMYHIQVEGVGETKGRLIVFTEKERLNTF